MAWFNFFKKKENVIEDTKHLNIQSELKTKTVRVYDRDTVYQSIGGIKRYDELLRFHDPDFDVIEKAVGCESYLNRSINRFVEMIWKNGYTFTGKNKKIVKYIKKRFDEMAYVSKKPTSVFFEEISKELITYANVFIHKIRNSKASTGRKVNFMGKVLEPICMYDILKTNNVCIKAQDHYKIESYIYIKPEYSRLFDLNHKEPSNPFLRYRFLPRTKDQEEYQPEDVIHMYINRIPGDFYGVPYIMAVLDDARTLRRMEENIDILLFQHMIPLLHYTVGTDTNPSREGEIDEVTANISNMLAEGMVISSHRHKIEAVSTKQATIDPSPFLAYFKLRVLSGMGQSIVSIGESGESSRATADVLMESVYDMCDRYKLNIESFINDFIISELLAEGGYDPFVENNKVSLFIEESNKTIKGTLDQQTLQLYMGGAITENEARERMGYEPLTGSERNGLYLAIKAEYDSQYTETQAVARQSASQTNATNQYGQSTGRTKRTSDEYESLIAQWLENNLDKTKDEAIKNLKKINYKFFKDKKTNIKDLESFFENVSKERSDIKDLHKLYHFIDMKKIELKNISDKIFEDNFINKK